jgi:hypothetical protein
MTGEMVKPRNAELGNDYWKGKSTSWSRIIGDEGVLIRPNYPDIFNLSDKLTDLGIENEVCPFDVYQGPYIEIGKNSFLPCNHLEIWYSDDYHVAKWSIVSGLAPITARSDKEAIKAVTTILPLLRLSRR